MPAAIAFFKAFKVYPAPQQLLMIYEQTMPREIFMLVVSVSLLRAALGSTLELTCSTGQ